MKIWSLVLLGMLVGCVGSAASYGTGPITLSSSAKEQYRSYNSFQSAFGWLPSCSTGFAVTLDGKGSNNNFELKNCDSRHGYVVDAAIKNCEKINNRQCRMYAVGDKIVWRR